MEANSVIIDRYKPRGATRLVRALGASIRGLRGAFREEAAFRQELAFALIVIPLALWLGHNGIEDDGSHPHHEFLSPHSKF